MLTSSPTISASASPSTAFHASAHRSYHAASRRPSAPSTAHSPRFAVSSAAARRLDAPPTPTPTPRPAFTATLPSPPIATTTTTAPEPPSCKRAYTDAGTQYTPDGLPPTHRPSPTPALTHGTPTDSLTAPAIAPSPRGHASASPVATEPPVPSEPHVRVDAQPASPAQHATTAQPHTRRTPKQKARSPPEPEPEPAYEQPALQRAASTVLQVAASPAKRARPEDDRTVQMMPLQYETCDVKHLGVLISDMLMELVRLNDGYPLRDGTLTRFHSRAPPGISVRDYLSRLVVHATLSPPILLSMVFYVDKLCAMYPAFTISSLTVHRFLITAATVAAKGLSDSFWTNSLYARVGGVSVRELALLELEFLRKLDWRIVPKPEVLVDYYKGLVDRGAGYAMERETDTGVTLVAPQAHPSPGSATGIHTHQNNT